MWNSNSRICSFEAKDVLHPIHHIIDLLIRNISSMRYTLLLFLKIYLLIILLM